MLHYKKDSKDKCWLYCSESELLLECVVWGDARDLHLLRSRKKPGGKSYHYVIGRCRENGAQFFSVRWWYVVLITKQEVRKVYASVSWLLLRLPALCYFYLYYFKFLGRKKLNLNQVSMSTCTNKNNNNKAIQTKQNKKKPSNWRNTNCYFIKGNSTGLLNPVWDLQ